MKWFAIFKTGRHTNSNGVEREWSENDIDKIVESYDNTKHEAPIVIGHPKNNAPAYGWIEKLKRVGDTLYALPKQLAQEFVEMVNKGLFKKRSISLYPDLSLRHVGFLGAQPPAVKGLPDVEFKEEDLSTIEIEETTDLEGLDYQEEQIKVLESKISEYEEQIQLLSNKDKLITELNAKILILEADKARLEEQMQTQKRAEEISQLNAVIDEAIDEGRLLPKMKETITKLYDMLFITKSIDFSEGKGTELFVEFIKGMPKLIEFNETNRNNQQTEEAEKPVSKIVAEEIRKQMKQ